MYFSLYFLALMRLSTRLEKQETSMKSLLSALLVFCAACAVAFAQKTTNFEGVVMFKKKGETHGIADSVIMRLYIKGDKFMAEDVNDVNQPRIIVDTKRKTIFMVTDRSREYMEIPMPAAPAGTVTRPPSKTNEKQTIAGHSCEQWIEKGQDMETELWASSDMGKLSLPSGSMGVNLISSYNMASFLKNSNLFPLLFIERTKAGREITRMEVMTVEKKSLTDGVFEPPQGYSKLVMSTERLSDKNDNISAKKKK